MFKIHSLIFISCLTSNNLAVPPSVCFADFRWDDCGKPPKAVMYYYKPGSRCEIGMWKGCMPNPNMFADEYECINTCVFVQRSVMQTGKEEPEKKAEYEYTTVDGAEGSPRNKGADQTERPESDLDHKYEYNPEPDTWLRLHIVPQTWEYAIRQCELEGGVLASPSSLALTNAMLAMMTDHNVTSSRGVFIGDYHISLNGVQGEHSTKDNSTDSDENKTCVVLDGKEAYNVSCNSKHSYFCRKENNSMVLHEDCNTTSAGYTYIIRTDSCYKLHPEPESWHEADRVCIAEGTNVATIDSDIEDEVLKEIFAKNAPKTGASTWRTIYHVETKNARQKRFFPVSGGFVQFQVRTSNDAHVALTTYPEQNADPMYAIIIGGWKNKQTAIRRGITNKVKVETPEILNADEFRGFWVRWHNGTISAGRENETTPFVSWKDPEPFLVGFLGICTCWDSTGTWKIDGHGVNITEADHNKTGESQPNDVSHKQTVSSMPRGDGLDDLGPNDRQPFFCEKSL